MKQTPHFSEGIRNDVALFFSCPGRFEETLKKPVAGKSGKNLDILLDFLHKKGFLSKYSDRYDFRITNASKNVHYKLKTGRTEELDSLINTEENLSRLCDELVDIKKYVICFGNKSEKAMRKMMESHGKKCEFTPIYIRHLSLLSLNQIKVSSDVKNKTEKRLEILADEVILQAEGK